MGETANCDVWPDSFANFGGAPAPPTHFFSLSLIGTKSTYQGGLQRLYPPPHHSAPWGDSACTTRVIHFKAAYFPSPTRTKGPESPVSSIYTPPPHQSPYPCPLPHPTAQGGARVCRGSGPPASTPYHTSPAKPRPGPTHPHPPASLPPSPSPYLEAGDAAAHLPAAGLQTEQRAKALLPGTPLPAPL